MDTILQDIRFALRVLRKNSGFTVVAVLTLALGIGANTAFFSMINSVLLRPLPYQNSEQLVSVNTEDPASSLRPFVASFTRFEAVEKRARSFAAVGAYYSLAMNLSLHGNPEQIRVARASSSFLDVLGVAPVKGRGFLPQEDAEGGADVAIVTDNFWHSHLGGDRNVVGETIALDGRSTTIVGILPANFRLPFEDPEPEVWLTRAFDNPAIGKVKILSGATYLSIFARLRPHVSLEQARADIAAINASYKHDFPGFADATKLRLRLDPLKEVLVQSVRTPLLVLLAAVGLVLLIGCANVASLLLARGAARQREIAIRNAIGASRTRLVRQLLTESVILSLAGGFAGICVALVGIRLLRSLPTGAIPRVNEIAIDTPVLFFTLLLSLLTGIGFGLLPAWLASRQNMNDTLKEAKGSSTGRRSGFSQSLLVVGEVAIAAVLVIGAGMLLKSFGKLMRVNPGLNAEHVMTFSIKLPASRYAQPQQQADFYRRLDEDVQAIPGVQSAAAVRYLPLANPGLFVYFCAEGRVCEGLGKDPIISSQQITPDYFRTMQIPLLRGRFFDEHDNAASRMVVIISDKTAREYFAGRDPIGLHLANSRDKIPLEIVGVVGDVKSLGLNANTVEQMYQPSEQNPGATMTLVVRSAGDSEALVTAVRHKLAQIDADLPLANIGTMQTVVATSVSTSRLTSQFTGGFALLALLLTAIGIYGVVAYAAAQRTHEMGIRLALGATRAHVLQLVIGQGMKVVLAGIGIGFVLALGLTRYIKTLLFGTSATDPWTFIAVTILLLATAALACYLPARRAARVDPLVALRYE